MADTPFFPSWGNRFNPMGAGPGRVLRQVRSYTLCKLETCFGLWVPPQLFPKAGFE